MKIIFGTLLIVLACSQAVRSNLTRSATPSIATRPVQYGAPVHASYAAPVQYAQAPVQYVQAPTPIQYTAPVVAPVAPAWGGWGNCYSGAWQYEACLKAWEEAENARIAKEAADKKEAEKKKQLPAAKAAKAMDDAKKKKEADEKKKAADAKAAADKKAADDKKKADAAKKAAEDAKKPATNLKDTGKAFVPVTPAPAKKY